MVGRICQAEPIVRAITLFQGASTFLIYQSRNEGWNKNYERWKNIPQSIDF